MLLKDEIPVMFPLTLLTDCQDPDFSLKILFYMVLDETLFLARYLFTGYQNDNAIGIGGFPLAPDIDWQSTDSSDELK